MLQRAWSTILSRKRQFIQQDGSNTPSQRTFVEEKKVIIEKSFWVALRRCAVHVVPLSISIFILSLNLKGYYIGTIFPTLIESETINLLLLQVAAKGHELLIIASLTTIIFHISRHELLFGDGLPLGLVGSGLLFGNLGYFFSREFVGSLSYAGNKWRKAGFLITLLIAGVTAALVGPSSAVLMVPTNQKVTGGGTSFYMKGSKEDLWPIHLNSNLTHDIPHCNSGNSTKYAVCPSGGFHSLWAHFGQGDSINFNKAIMARTYAKKLSGSSSYWSLDSPLSLVPRVYSLGNGRVDNGSQASTFRIQPHAATAVMLQQVTTDWWEALTSQSKHKSDSIDDRVAQARVISPLTRVKCSAPQNMSATSRNVEFPVLQPQYRWSGFSNLAVGSLNANATDHLRFQWIHLPEQFGVATIGSIFESPWTSDNSSRVVVGCTVQATWVNATIYTDEYTFWSGWYPWDIEFGSPYPPWLPPNTGEPSSPTNGRIAVNDSWLDMLTPPTPPDGPSYYPWKPSTIESILTNAGLSYTPTPHQKYTMVQDWLNGDTSVGNRTALLELIICSVFEDGLSRSGIQEVYNMSGSPSIWTLSTYDQKIDFKARILSGQDAFDPPHPSSGDFTRLRVNMSVSGYAYQGSLAEYLAMTVLFVHVVFALVHTAWILFQSETSDSWDSVSKIVALAQNSKPAFGALKNTGGGIDRFRTFARIAKIRATRDADSIEPDHVQLIFKDTRHERFQRIHDGDEQPLVVYEDPPSDRSIQSDLESLGEDELSVVLQDIPHETFIRQELQIPRRDGFLGGRSFRTHSTWPVYSSRNTSFSSTTPLVVASSRKGSVSSMQATKSRPGSISAPVEIEHLVHVGQRYG